MKKIVFILIIIFNFQTLSKASDIFDFDTAKMNIGLSLLHYVSKNEINDTDRFTLIVEGPHFYEFQKNRAYK